MPPTAWASLPLADATIPKPPSPLTEPEVTVLPNGTELHRVHNSLFGAAQFNPGRGSRTRFAPFNDCAGMPVPSLYASDTLRAAIHETIFHDIPAGDKGKTVRLANVEEKTHSELSTLRDLRLVELRNVTLSRWSISRRDLISSSPVCSIKPCCGPMRYIENFRKLTVSSEPPTSVIPMMPICSLAIASAQANSR